MSFDVNHSVSLILSWLRFHGFVSLAMGDDGPCSLYSFVRQGGTGTALIRMPLSSLLGIRIANSTRTLFESQSQRSCCVEVSDEQELTRRGVAWLRNSFVRVEESPDDYTRRNFRCLVCRVFGFVCRGTILCGHLGKVRVDARCWMFPMVFSVRLLIVSICELNENQAASHIASSP